LSKKAAARQFIAENINDIDTLLAHLDRFAELGRAYPELWAGDFEAGEVMRVAAPFFAASPPEGARPLAIVEAIVHRLVDRARVDRMRNSITRVLRKRDLDDEDATALATVGALVDAPLGTGHLNPLWQGAALSSLDALFRMGILLSRLARPRTARAAGSPTLPFDAVLHLALANQRFVAEHATAFIEHGRSDSMARAAEAAFAEAFARDFTRDVGDHYRIVCESHVRAAQDQGDTMAAAGAIAWLQQSADEEFVKDLYASTLESSYLADDDEQPFVARIGIEDATDRWALEEYERFLLANGERERARRVRRFMSRDR
jgi:hypothetical protein